MTRLLELAAVGLGLWVVSCLVMVLLATRLPPGLMRDVAEFLPACVTTAKRLRSDPSVPRRAKVALLVAIVWVVSPIDLLPEFLPVIGPLDDVVAVVLLLRYAARSIPREVLVAAWPAQPRLLDRLLGPAEATSARGGEVRVMRRREPLAELSGARCAADGGLETSLIAAGQELPLFAAFVLLEHEEGRQALRDYYAPYLELARARGVLLVLDTPTWRASSAWGDRLGWSAGRLAAANRVGVELLEELRGPGRAFAISGCVGPRTDSAPGDPVMDAAEAEAYHGAQVATLAAAGADLVTALTLTSSAEAIGIVRAAAASGIPVVVSLQVGRDGRLAGGQTLADAITQIDAETAGAAASFMLNCAHPTHVAAALEPPGPWLERIGGLRANAAAGDGDPGDSPRVLAAGCEALAPRLPGVTVLGGCCGTDHRHVDALLEAWG